MGENNSQDYYINTSVYMHVRFVPSVGLCTNVRECLYIRKRFRSFIINLFDQMISVFISVISKHSVINATKTHRVN